jgi:hypothetical protein
MGFRAGDEVIVTTPDNNQLGVVLSKRIISKLSVYDVLLESRTALVMLGTAPSAKTYINKQLTAKLCDTELICSTIPYKELVADEKLPHLDANSAGKASW